MGASAEIGQFSAVAWRKVSIFESTLHKVLELYKMHIIANLETAKICKITLFFIGILILGHAPKTSKKIF